MKKTILLTLLLAGCASTNTVLQEQPKEVFHSQDSAVKVAFCLANKNNVAALDQEDGSKVVLIKNGYQAVSMAFTVYPEGSGSRVEYRLKRGIVGAVWKQCVGLKPTK